MTADGVISTHGISITDNQGSGHFVLSRQWRDGLALPLTGIILLCGEGCETPHLRRDEQLSSFLFPRQPSRVLVRSFAEARLHTRRHGDGVLSELLAHSVGGGERLVPLLMRGVAFQAEQIG